MRQPRFGQSFPLRCAMPGCDGKADFSECGDCGAKTCGRHHPSGFFAAFKAHRCPLCGSADVKKL